jgi:ribose transport system substrate-binding protein
VSDAMSRNIPVVIFDSGLKGNNYVSFVATDNVKGGRMAGERIAEVLGGKGKVVLLRYAEGHDSTGKREQGFLEAIAEHPGLEVVSSNQYGGTDVDGAYKRAEALLTTFKKADGSLDVGGIFCPNESSSFAMLRVLQDNGWAGKVALVGFDASPGLVKALRDGDMNALVVQDPVQMGYLAVKTLNAHIKGEKVEPSIDTAVFTVTRENMETPEMQALIEPDLSQWLNR